MTSDQCRRAIGTGLLAAVIAITGAREGRAQSASFRLLEATVDEVHAAYKAGTLTARRLVQLYLDRIDAYDKKGPALNAIITINAEALSEADRLDAAFRKSGLTGPLHGIPIVVKDQFDVRGIDDWLSGTDGDTDGANHKNAAETARHQGDRGSCRAGEAQACTARPAGTGGRDAAPGRR